MVSLPIATIDTSVTNFTQPVVTSAINAADNLVGFQGDFTFDETVVTFQSPPVSSAGLTASNWNVSGNVLPGAGPDQDAARIGLLERLHAAVRLGDSLQSEHDQGEQHPGCYDSIGLEAGPG